jgi:hypothetical protein
MPRDNLSSSGMETSAISKLDPNVGTLLDNGFILMPQVKREIKNVFVVQNQQTIENLLGQMSRLRGFVVMDPGAQRIYNDILGTLRALFGSDSGIRVGD